MATRGSLYWRVQPFARPPRRREDAPPQLTFVATSGTDRPYASMMDRDERAEKLTSTVSGNSSSGLTTHSSMDTERVGHPHAMQRKAPEGGDVESPKVPYTEVRNT